MHRKGADPGFLLERGNEKFEKSSGQEIYYFEFLNQKWKKIAATNFWLRFWLRFSHCRKAVCKCITVHIHFMFLKSLRWVLPRSGSASVVLFASEIFDLTFSNSLGRLPSAQDQESQLLRCQGSWTTLAVFEVRNIACGRPDLNKVIFFGVCLSAQWRIQRVMPQGWLKR